MDFTDDAKQFNSKLEELDQKFKEMERVSEDQKKITTVFEMAEKALEQKSNFSTVLERLKVLEKMNEESPNLEARMQKIIQKAAKEIPQALKEEQEVAQAARVQIIEAAQQLDMLA